MNNNTLTQEELIKIENRIRQLQTLIEMDVINIKFYPKMNKYKELLIKHTKELEKYKKVLDRNLKKVEKNENKIY